MNEGRRLKAMLVGIVAGAILIAAALVTLAISAHARLFRDLVGFGLGVIVDQ
jgi:hypothetical protein